MFRVNEIEEKMLHLVGWKQNYDMQEFVIANSLTESESGIYFQQSHPLLTLQNLKAIAPDFKNITYNTWDVDDYYTIGAKVSYENASYRAKTNNTGKVPGISYTDWEIFDAFSEWLEDKTKGSIVKAITNYLNDRLSDGSAKSLLESKILFDGAGRIYDTIQNTGSAVGFEIVPIRSKGVTIKINKIGMQLTNVGQVNIYIMHSSMLLPYKKITVEKTRKGSMEWFTMDDLYLPYISCNDAGGSWYLIYNQSDLVNNLAIQKDKDWSKTPCLGCSPGEYASWQSISKYIEVYPFRVSEEDLNAVRFNEDFNSDFYSEPFVLWDIQRNLHTYNTNYGLNLDISVECDITDFLIEQKRLFRDIIAKQVAIDFLYEMAYNPYARINKNSINASRTDILFALEGDSTSFKKSGLVYQLSQAYKAIEVSTQGIDRVCLPCKKTGIRYRTV